MLIQIPDLVADSDSDYHMRGFWWKIINKRQIYPTMKNLTDFLRSGSQIQIRILDQILTIQRKVLKLIDFFTMDEIPFMDDYLFWGLIQIHWSRIRIQMQILDQIISWILIKNYSCHTDILAWTPTFNFGVDPDPLIQDLDYDSGSENLMDFNKKLFMTKRYPSMNTCIRSGYPISDPDKDSG